MKVSGAKSGSGVSGGTRSVGKSDGKRGEFQKALAQAVGESDGVFAADGPSVIGAVDALLMAQSMGDATEREARKAMVRRGEDILDRLEELRHGLLLGILPEDKLVSLSEMVRTRRADCHDPRLAGLLDEIELRAEVEIAKLSRKNGRP